MLLRCSEMPEHWVASECLYHTHSLDVAIRVSTSVVVAVADAFFLSVRIKPKVSCSRFIFNIRRRYCTFRGIMFVSHFLLLFLFNMLLLPLMVLLPLRCSYASVFIYFFLFFPYFILFHFYVCRSWCRCLLYTISRFISFYLRIDIGKICTGSSSSSSNSKKV